MLLTINDTSPVDTKNAAVSSTAAATIKVILIRHGESQSNAGLPTLSTELADLTNRGRSQAQKIANYLFRASLIPDLIVISPYRRADQTAFPLKYHILKEYSKRPLEEKWPVQEFTYLSKWHTVFSTRTDRQEAVNDYWQKADPTYIDGPGSESFEQFINRVSQFKTHLESSEHGTIAVFSHEQFISAFLLLLRHGNITPTTEEMIHFRANLMAKPLPNGTVIQVEFHKGNGKWAIKRIAKNASKWEGALVSTPHCYFCGL